ncbi:AraC family transcriptional regulator [Breznakiella homolactica]|uniref:AraC family transcriptional regulator n=1 Tax=Breznakiella homolactica TaxID=2798577 RepID=A0A7T8B993_9SPIR|nr:AraC family transcriptional regulator [Breznakiella homolactica]QQO08106.1 AraC family transcriptional regulator [Breznakiella homolactica]
MSEYQMTSLTQEFEIESIVSVHYFEYSKDYLFLGERHDFWEILYVDKGEVTVRADDNYIVLSRGEMIFHKPNEFHMVIANGIVAPNLVVASFVCRNPAMESFRDRIVILDEQCKKYMGQIVAEAKNAFSSPLGDPYLKALEKRRDSKFGCEQLISVYLQLLLISIMRMDGAPAITSANRQHYNEEIYKKITVYLEENLDKNLSINHIATHFSLSKTSLKSLFRENNSLGVMEYLRNLRIERAKQMIREETMNFTRISETLGFSSIHYFSRVFRKNVGMSPSEYATSVKVLVDRNTPEDI